MENMDNDEDETVTDRVKRFKLGRSEDSMEEAGSSSDGGFARRRNSKNRNYRTRRTDDTNEENDDDVEDNSQIQDENPAAESEEVQTEEIEEVPTEETVSNSSADTSEYSVWGSESEADPNRPAPLNKESPKHNWFVLRELSKRQYGGIGSKLQSSTQFKRRCYGSLRNVQRLELMYKLENHHGCVNSLNFHPNGSLLASGSDDLAICLWDWKVGKCLLKFDTKHTGNVFQSKFLNLSGELHIASCARDGQVRLTHVAIQEGVRESRKMGSHSGPCHKLAVMLDQPQVFLSAGEDGVVFSHDVRNRKAMRVVKVLEDEVEVPLYSINCHPLRSQEFCVSGRDHIVRVYDQRKGNETLTRHYPREINECIDYGNFHVTCAIYNHNGSEILASYNDADIFLFDAQDGPGKYLHKYEGHRNGATIKGVNFFGPKSEFIVSGSDCGNVFFWERNTEAIVQYLMADDNGVVNCLEPHPEVPYICTSGLDWDVKVWVPSNENEPDLRQLAQTVKENNNSRLSWSSPMEENESQLLWMLWRHLRNANRHASYQPFENNVHLFRNSSSNDSDSSSPSTEDDEDIGNPSGCSTS